MDYPKTRKEAKELGATHYFTGEPCVRGHVAPRKTKGACVECMKEDWAADNERRKSKPKSDAAKAAGRRYYEKNKDLVLARANNHLSSVARHDKRGRREIPKLFKPQRTHGNVEPVTRCRSGLPQSTRCKFAKSIWRRETSLGALESNTSSTTSSRFAPKSCAASTFRGTCRFSRTSKIALRATGSTNPKT